MYGTESANRRAAVILPTEDAEEMIDFTCATPWERLALDIELLLRQWKVHDNGTVPEDPRKTELTFGSLCLCLELVTKSDLDIGTILGIRECVVAGPRDTRTVAVTDASEAASVLSAMTVAASACNCTLPLIVRVGAVDSLRFIGRQVTPTDQVRFSCDYTSYPSADISNVPGLLSLFQNKRNAARRRDPSSLYDAEIAADFTYYWTDFSFQVTIPTDSFASDRMLTSYHRDLLPSADLIEYLVLSAIWAPFPASPERSTGAFSDMPPKSATRFRLRTAQGLFDGASLPRKQTLPISSASRACLRMAKSSDVAETEAPAAQRPYLATHALSACRTKVAETQSAPTIGSASQRGYTMLDLEPGNSEASLDLGAPPSGLDEYLAHATTFVESAALEDEKVDEEYLASAVAAVFELNGDRGLVVDVVDALGPGASGLSLLQRLAKLIAGAKSATTARLLWGLFLDGVEVHWENSWPIRGIMFDTVAGPSLGDCILLQKLQMVNCCAHRLRLPHDTGESNPMGRKAVLKDQELVGESSSRSNHDAEQTVWEPMVQPLPYVTRDFVEAEQNKMVRSASGESGNSEHDGRRQATALKSDMMSFKAANPDASMADFVRWFSPADWEEDEDVESAPRECAAKAGGPAAVAGDAEALGDTGDSGDSDVAKDTSCADGGSALKRADEAGGPGDGKEAEHTEEADEADKDDKDENAALNTTGMGVSPSAAAGESAITAQSAEGSHKQRPRGRLSGRMRAPGNLWQAMWDAAEPIPASKQTLLFDPRLHGYKAISDLRSLSMREVLRQLACVDVEYATYLLHTAFQKNPDMTRIHNAISVTKQSLARAQQMPVGDASGFDATVDACDKLSQAEFMSIGASSLLRKLPPGAGFMSAIDRLVAGESVEVDAERDRASLVLVVGLEESGWRAPLEPSYREFVIEASNRDRMYARLSSDEFRAGLRLVMDYST